MITKHIGFWAGPCVGKSTTAAYVFSQLKQQDYNCELISEYAKDIVWEESFNKLKNQIYVFGKQHQKHFVLNGKVDFVITDSPLPLTLIYDQNNTEYLKELVMSEFNKFDNINIFLERSKKYNPVGRMQTYEEAVEKDKQILQFMEDNKIPYIKMSTIDLDLIIDEIKRQII